MTGVSSLSTTKVGLHEGTEDVVQDHPQLCRLWHVNTKHMIQLASLACSVTNWRSTRALSINVNNWEDMQDWSVCNDCRPYDLISNYRLHGLRYFEKLNANSRWSQSVRMRVSVTASGGVGFEMCCCGRRAFSAICRCCTYTVFKLNAF
jgi:hypothetical protein